VTSAVIVASCMAKLSPEFKTDQKILAWLQKREIQTHLSTAILPLLKTEPTTCDNQFSELVGAAAKLNANEASLVLGTIVFTFLLTPTLDIISHSQQWSLVAQNKD
jgi:hypothetical protein